MSANTKDRERTEKPQMLLQLDLNNAIDKKVVPNYNTCVILATSPENCRIRIDVWD